MIRLRQNASPKDIAALGGGDEYRLHKLIWDLFSDGPNRKRDFLYHNEMINGLPTFYTISEREPNLGSSLWDVIVKKYAPRLAQGERLSFKLRANPVQQAKKERPASEIEEWLRSREKIGLKQKEPTKKRIRHDVVMEEKSRIGFKELQHDQRPHVAALIQNAGMAWLKAKEKEFGFFVEDEEINPIVRVDGYRQHRLFRGRGQKPMTFNTLDFNGTLTVTEPEIFVTKCLFNGIGPAKAFGCGLMLVRRV
jgi:CRISPR system Cascade subunit CasE